MIAGLGNVRPPRLLWDAWQFDLGREAIFINTKKNKKNIEIHGGQELFVSVIKNKSLAEVGRPLVTNLISFSVHTLLILGL